MSGGADPVLRGHGCDGGGQKDGLEDQGFHYKRLRVKLFKSIK
jgi:hypothetical protein